MGVYRKSIIAAIAWVGTLATFANDLSLSDQEISGLVIGALGVYGVYKARNDKPSPNTPDA